MEELAVLELPASGAKLKECWIIRCYIKGIVLYMKLTRCNLIWLVHWKDKIWISKHARQ